MSHVFHLSLLCFAAFALSGCSSTRPTIGGISVTDTKPPNPAISSVVVGATANVSASVGNDGPNLGVDWTLNCGGSPNTALEPASVACGSLNPVHVGSDIVMVYTAPAYVPTGNTVTLTATATSDPAVSASVNLTIVPKPIAIAWTQGFMPPATGCPSGISYCMAASGTGFQNSPQQAVTASLGATVSYDPLAQGVVWSCSPAGSCGSFNPTPTASGSSTTYTAPSTIPSGGLPVTITATPACETEKPDPCSSTTSISETITLMPVEVAVAALPSTVGARGGNSNLTATVTWDASNGGVTWSAACSAGTGACGTITQGNCGTGVAPTYASSCSAVYTPPDSIPAGASTLPITVTAQSIADPTTRSSTAITVGPPPPIDVSVAGPSGASQMGVQVNGTIVLTATVANDFSNGGTSAGVNWNCSPGSCSPATSNSLPFTTIYTAPNAIPVTNPVTVTAVSIFCSGNPASSQCAGDAAATGSASILILPSITVMITPPASITAGVAATFSATVTNDIGTAGVDWSASCSIGSTCGTFTPAHTVSGASTTFLAPNSLPWSEDPNVTITATSTASETTPPIFPSPYLKPGAGVQDPVSVPVIPVTYVHFVPFAPSQLPMGGNAVSLIAAAANDTNHSGVDWSVCASLSTCGGFQVNQAVPATQTAAGKSATYSSTIHAASGQAVTYLPPTATPAGGTVTITVASTSTPTAIAAQAVTITNNTTFTGVSLTGKVLAGSLSGGLPISGASVQLYQAGNTGYGSAANPLTITPTGGFSVATASDGSFTIPSGYTCSPANTLLYLVAIGGTPRGLSSPNGQLGLMTALGPCSNLNSLVPLVVNEVTTVAAAWALAPFTGNGGNNFQDYEYIGSSGTNYNNGLANAFATVNNLVDITTGQALMTTPAGGGFTPPSATSEVYSGVVPKAEINTLADAIDTCAATSGGLPGDGSACDAFFQASNVHPVGGPAGSTNSPDTLLRAVLEVAKYPSKIGVVGNMSSYVTGTPLYILVSNLVESGGTPPFPEILSAPPTDWTIALNFTGGGLEGIKKARSGSTGMAIDASGNLWIGNPVISSVTELSNLGVALSPYTTYATGSTTQITPGGFTGGGLNRANQTAIDPYGDVWALNIDGSLSEGTPSCLSPTSLNPFCGKSSFPYAGSGNAAVGLAIDGTGNLWVADSGSPGDVAEYAGFDSCQHGSSCTSGGTQVPTGALIADFTNLTNTNDPLDTQPANPQTIAIDGKDNVWVLDESNYAAIELSGKSSSLELVDHGYSGRDQSGNPITPELNSSGQWGTTVAIDSTGDIFIPNGSPDYLQMYELDACPSGSGSLCGFGPPEPITLSVTPSGFGESLAIDGSNDIWLIAYASSTSAVQPASVFEISTSGTVMNLNTDHESGFNSFGYVASSYASSPQQGSTVIEDTATPWAPSPESIATDASGNLWVLLSNPSSVEEFIGVATPVVTPLSLGKPGSTP